MRVISGDHPKRPCRGERERQGARQSPPRSPLPLPLDEAKRGKVGRKSKAMGRKEGDSFSPMTTTSLSPLQARGAGREGEGSMSVSPAQLPRAGKGERLSRVAKVCLLGKRQVREGNGAECQMLSSHFSLTHNKKREWGIWIFFVF